MQEAAEIYIPNTIFSTILRSGRLYTSNSEFKFQTYNLFLFTYRHTISGLSLPLSPECANILFFFMSNACTLPVITPRYRVWLSG